jgi:tetratricopeptide (TPR) repeat protein
MAEIDVTLIAQAETFYRKGEILINMGDFRGALEYLKNAVELYPDEAVYQSDLAWSYYKKSPPERAPALKHIRKALDLNPSDTAAQFRLSVIERSS